MVRVCVCAVCRGGDDVVLLRCRTKTKAIYPIKSFTSRSRTHEHEHTSQTISELFDTMRDVTHRFAGCARQRVCGLPFCSFHLSCKRPCEYASLINELLVEKKYQIHSLWNRRCRHTHATQICATRHTVAYRHSTPTRSSPLPIPLSKLIEIWLLCVVDWKLVARRRGIKKSLTQKPQQI